MAGQTLANLHLKGDYDLGPLSLQHFVAPDLMSIVANVIAHWSLVQLHLGIAFAELIGARSAATVATVNMYASFDSFATQRKMLVTAAEELLPARCSETFRATLTVIEQAAKERHRFAHWIWGTYLDGKLRNELLLLVDPRHVYRLRPAQIRHFQKKFDKDVHVSQPRLDQKLIWAYRKDDLLRARHQMHVAEKLAYGLCDLVRSKPKRRLEIQRQLRAQPDIRQVLDIERQRKTKSRKAAPKPPRVSRRARREAVLARQQEKKGA